MSADLDKQIDRAVREMLDVEPRADLRARVLERLPASGSQLPASGFRLPAFGSRLRASGTFFDFVASGVSRNRLVFAAAAVALIVLAVFVARRSEPGPQAPVSAQRADVGLPSEGTPPVIAGRRSPLVVPDAAVSPSGATTRRAPRTADDRIVYATDAATAIEPLTSIAPISVEAIEPEPIAPAEIAVRPLNAIAEIQIAPLTPDRR